MRWWYTSGVVGSGITQCVGVVGADVGVISIQCVGAVGAGVGAVGAGVGVVSILVLWTVRLHDADDSVISVQIVNLGYA